MDSRLLSLLAQIPDDDFKLYARPEIWVLLGVFRLYTRYDHDSFFAGVCIDRLVSLFPMPDGALLRKELLRHLVVGHMLSESSMDLCPYLLHQYEGREPNEIAQLTAEVLVEPFTGTLPIHCEKYVPLGTRLFKLGGNRMEVLETIQRLVSADQFKAFTKGN